MKFWSRTTVVWLKPFVYVWKSSWVKTPNCCKLSQRTEKLKLKIHWKAYLLVLDYWFFCCCCHIWSHRLTILSKSRGFLPLIWPRPNVWFSPSEIIQQSEWLQRYLFQSWAWTRRKRWLWGKFWDKEPILSHPMAVRFQPNLSCWHF